MKKTTFFILMITGFLFTQAQASAHDSLAVGKVQVILKDSRIDMLGKKMAEYNENLSVKTSGIKMVRGYRLMVLSSSDRNLAMSVRSRLLQSFPEQKIYMTFQSPYIKLKFGNFADKTDAERYRRQISASGIVEGNIYMVPETVEIKVDRSMEE